MRCFLLFFLTALLSPLAARAQASAGRAIGKATITGVVVDSATGKPLLQASVSLLAARDSAYLTFTVTGGEGQFALRGVAPGTYQVLLTMVGYASRRVPVRLTAAQPTVALGTLRLSAHVQQLDEATVVFERAPVSVQGDTLVFSAPAFRTQPNAAVEALLKKLPGVEVDRNGKIKAQGKNVTRVLVDGKPFFGDDPKIATRQLPAEIIDQVQIFDQQNDQAAFNGLDQNGARQRSINLVTKRDKRKGYFGTNAVGVGSAARYQGRLGLNRFDNGRQLSLLGAANNLNQPDFGDNEAPGLGLDGSPYPGGAAEATTSATSPTSIREAGALGTQYRDAWGRRAEVAMSYLGSRSIETADQQLRREAVTTATTASGFVTARTAYARTRLAGQRFFGRLDYQIDTLTSVRLTPSLFGQRTTRHERAEQATTTQGQVFNENTSRYSATTDGLSGGGTALLMRKFRRTGRTFSVSYTAQLSTQDGTDFNRARNTFFAPDTATFGLDQRIGHEAATRQQTVNLSFVEPLSLTRKVEVHAALAAEAARAIRTTFDGTEATGTYAQFNPGLSNAFTSAFIAPRWGALVQTRHLHYSWSLGADVQRAALAVRNRTADTAFRQHFTTVLPTAMVGWTGTDGRQLRLAYRTQFDAPAADQLQPVADNTDPLHVVEGNPGLRPEYTHQVTVTYNRFELARNRSVFGFVSHQRVVDRITPSTTFSPGGAQRTQPVNADGYHTSSGFLSLGQRLAPLKLNINLITQATYTRGTGFVQERFSRSRTCRIGQGLRVNSAFDDRLEVGFGADIAWQQAYYQLQPQQNAVIWTRAVSADVYYQLPGQWVFTADLWATAATGRAAGFNQRVMLVNAGLARQFFANRQAELKLAVFDLLNQNRGLDRTVADTYVEDRRSRILNRYVLLSFTYTLRKFGV